MDNGAVLMALRAHEREAALGEAARHDPEGLAGARRRQVVHRARRTASSTSSSRARAGLRSSTRTSSAASAARRRSSPRRPSPAAASTSRRWTRSTRSGRRGRPGRGQARGAEAGRRRTRRRARRRTDRAVRVAGEARRAGPAARAALRREGPLRARGAVRDLHARRPEGRLCRLVLHAGRRRRPQAGLVKATAGALTGHGARARDPAAAVELRLRGHDRRGAAALLDQLDRQVLRARPRRHEGAHEAQRHPAHQARPAVLRARTTAPTTPSRRTCSRASGTARWATAA